MKKAIAKISLLSVLFTLLIQSLSYAQTDAKDISWEDQFNNELPYLGHRNWILIVDAAYPLQSSTAIKTIISDAKIENVTKRVLNSIDKADHVKAIVYQDKEFSFMKNEWSENCEKLKENMNTLLAPYNPNVILHDEIFSKLDTASKLFNVLVIKTNCTIPYSSIFIELDCGYWNSSAEEALRKAMK